MSYKRSFILMAFTMAVLFSGALFITGCEKSRQDGGPEKAAKSQKGSGPTMAAQPLRPAGETAESSLNLATAIIQVAKSNIPAVVHIEVAERQEVPNPYLPFGQDPSLRRFFGLPKNMPKKFEREVVGVGTGIIIDAQGHILTNNHVVGGANK
ncbi:MAG: hypothetical protein MUO52_02880, partial [Desulfobacterales bacterium]|nr:hypothetical protein [Desulfobacterales bacterium]